MRRDVLTVVVAIVFVVALLAIGLSVLGFGFASQSQTDNTGNSVGTEYQVIASMKDNVGNEMMVQIPSVSYRLDGDYYTPDYKIRYTNNGTLHIVTPVRNGEPMEMDLRVLVAFNDAMSWSLLERLDLNLNGRTYNLYDATSDVRDGIAGDSSELILVKTGTYVFNLAAQYKSTVKMDPRSFDGDKMESNVAFVLNEVDPIGALTKTIKFLPGEQGTGTMEDQILDQSRPYLKKCTYTRGSWSFAYWTDSESNHYSDEGNVYALIDEHPETKAALTAHWGKSISFYPNGGYNSMPNQVIYEGSLSLNECVFERVGYAFDGWATSPGGEKVYNDREIMSIDIDDGTKLYAVWKLVKIVVTFKPNTEQLERTQDITMNSKNLQTVASLGYSKDGFIFLGWSDTNPGNPTIPDGADLSDQIGSSDSSMNLNAIWGKKVKFDANGGVGVMPDQELYDGDNNLHSNMFTRFGYSFEGWALTYNGSVEYEDGATITIDTFENNTKLYAVWEAIYVESVSVNGYSGPINVDSTLQLTFSVTPQTALIKTVTWTSSDPTKATVSNTGLVTGVAAGSTDITVTIDDDSGVPKTATCRVVVGSS